MHKWEDREIITILFIVPFWLLKILEHLLLLCRRNAFIKESKSNIRFGQILYVSLSHFQSTPLDISILITVQWWNHVHIIFWCPSTNNCPMPKVDIYQADKMCHFSLMLKPYKSDRIVQPLNIFQFV